MGQCDRNARSQGSVCMERTDLSSLSNLSSDNHGVRAALAMVSGFGVGLLSVGVAHLRGGAGLLGSQRVCRSKGHG